MFYIQETDSNIYCCMFILSFLTLLQFSLSLGGVRVLGVMLVWRCVPREYERGVVLPCHMVFLTRKTTGDESSRLCCLLCCVICFAAWHVVVVVVVLGDEGGGPGGVLPYMGYVGMCCWTGYGF